MKHHTIRRCASSDTITLPVYWASALINGDFSGITEACEANAIKEVQANLRAQGWTAVSTVEDSERFTWSYQLYDPSAECVGGTVLDYVIIRADQLTR